MAARPDNKDHGNASALFGSAVAPRSVIRQLGGKGGPWIRRMGGIPPNPVPLNKFVGDKLPTFRTILDQPHMGQRPSKNLGAVLNNVQNLLDLSNVVLPSNPIPFTLQVRNSRVPMPHNAQGVVQRGLNRLMRLRLPPPYYADKGKPDGTR